MSKFKIYGTILVFLTVLLIGFVTVKDYGVNWDEPIHYIRGQAYLRYLLTGKEDYDDLPKLKSHYPKFAGSKLPDNITFDDDSSFRRSIYQHDGAGKGTRATFSWFVDNDSGHPPLNGILASLFNSILYQKFGIVGDIESYHVFVIFVCAILTASIFLFSAHFYGMFAALIASVSLSIYPLFYSESHFNIKDPVEASFYSLAIIIFSTGVIKEKLKILILSAFFFGLALGTKFNIFFSLFTLIPWLIIYKFDKVKKLEWPFTKSITVVIMTIPFIASAILFLSWPFLWKNSWQHFLSIVTYYKDIGGMSYQIKRGIFFGFNTYAIQWVLFSTPLIILFLSMWGILFTLRQGLQEKEKTSLLVLLWFLVPIARVTMPNAGIYGGVRQIMEYIPAMAVLSGIGAGYLRTLILPHIPSFIPKPYRMTILTLLFFLFFLPITLKLVSIHPNENVYFNPLIGGLKGAKQKSFPDWGTTLGTVYKQGIDWINIHAEPNANLALIKGLLSNIPRTTIRKDINFYDSYYSGSKKQGEYLMEVTDYRWNIDIPEEKRKYIDTLKPVFEVKVDDTAILMIWKNDKEHLKVK